MKFKKTTLKNGLRVVTVPIKDNPAVTVMVIVDAGSKYETKTKNGISHFLEHMVFKGTPRRPKAIDISRELDSIGSHYNAFTGQEYTGYYAKVDPKHLDTALDIVSDMYLNPLFEESEIQKEKGVIVEEIRMYQDMPQRHIQDLFIGLLYGDQPAGWSIAGTEATVKSFDRKDFVDYRAQHYVASATTVIVAGSFGEKYDEKSLIAKIEEIFAGLSASKKADKKAVVEKQTEPRVLAHFKETDQTHLILGVRSFLVKSPHSPALRVLATILGGGMSSRLFQKLRDEMGVGYYVRADNDPYTDHGIFAVSAGVDNARVEEVVKAIIIELKKLVNEPVPPAELRKAKDYMNGSMMLSLESSDSQAEFCAQQEILKKEIKTPADIADEIEKVTANDVQEIARMIFKDESLNFALIGRFKDEAALKSILTFK
jgi:predicted Zn-dependent peptidase